MVAVVTTGDDSGGAERRERAADTLAARLDEGGVFSETVIVRGLPTGRTFVFVR